MMRIFIEDQQLDVYKDFTQQITYAVDDLLNIDSKATNFTKTIVIPGSTRNNTLLGNIFEFGNSNFYTGGANVFYNFNASVSARARIEVNGLSIMKGVLRLLRITHDKGTVEYEVALFGELGGLVTAIGNRKLEDIDFTKYNHNWNITNILDSWEPPAEFNFVGSYSFQTLGKQLSLILGKATSFKAGDTISISGTSSNNRTFVINTIYVSSQGTEMSLRGTVTTESGSDLTIKRVVTTSLGIGYTYPLINYGNVSYNIPSTNPSTAFRYKDWQFKAFRPAVYVREYMDRIITDSGYTWESEFFNTNFFKRLIVPNNDPELQRVGEDYLVNRDGSGIVSVSKTYSGTTSTGSIIPIKLGNNNALIDFIYSTGQGIYTYQGEKAKSINITLLYNGYINVTGISNFRNLYCNLDILLNNTTYLRSVSLSNIARDNNRIYFTAKLQAELTINPNDYFVCRFSFQDTQTNLTATYDIQYNDTEILVEPVPKGFVKYDYNNLLNFNNLTPRNVQQRDFFTSIMKMFNLMMVEDKYKEKHLKIEPDVYFYLTDRNTYLDWTEKIDRSQPIIITPMSEANARYYEFKYKDDSDYWNDFYKKKFNETYGNRLYDNQLEFAKNTQKVEVIFSPTVLEGTNNEDKVWSAIYKDNNGLEESTAHNIRILQCKLIKDVAAYKILNDTTVVTDASGITKYMYAGHFNDPDYPTSDLNWGAVKELQFTLVQGSLQNNLFNGFYSPYMAEITDKDSRLVQCTMKLTDIDVFNLDWRRYIFVDGILYRLKKIIDWTDDNTCKVELLRVINTTYLAEAITFDTTGISTQIWSSENLATLYYNNGDPIPVAKDAAEWQTYGGSGVGCCAFYKYDTADGSYGLSSGYGLYYNQFALKDSRGIAPSGWRLPTRQDFIDLDTATDGNALKQAGVITWAAGNTGTNATQFNAFGLGWIQGGDGDPQEEGITARYWSSTAYDSDETYFMQLGYVTSLIKTGDFGRNYDGYNVRLIKI